LHNVPAGVALNAQLVCETWPTVRDAFAMSCILTL
jgi:hypothetical protein